ncbi:N-acetylglucosaminyltransferase [Flavonifractor sp. An135]|nr:glycosyltransferase family 2 protein [Flavonifractor sp. An135]OUQ24939.1 N-acetylglucosaminyltransferase [Flavonifractor sp. An135]
MDMLRFVTYFNLTIAVVLTLAYFYQLVYLCIGLVRRKWGKAAPQAKVQHRYAAVISARNEENVIGELIRCLKDQNYPSELLDVYVVADNCTDNTAHVAKAAGAFVYQRFNKSQVGKGYALDYLFRRLHTEGRDVYDGYFIFDADNHVDPNFVKEMNNTFDSGKYAAITCYRNSKNFGENWISAGYGLWFLREARFLNSPRMALGTSCHVSGTGFLISADIIRENGGWPYHLLTEDIEFSVNTAIQGRTIGYCEKAVIYDEQPVTFRQSWDQRLRWSKGFYQVDFKYGVELIWGCFKGGRRGFSCYDMLMTVAPGMFLTLLGILFNAIILLACLGEPAYIANQVIDTTVEFIGMAVVNFYLCLFLFGVATTLTEWKQIHVAPLQKVAYMFSFPIFMFTYIPISIAALVKKVEWKPIYHGNRRQLSTQK